MPRSRDRRPAAQRFQQLDFGPNLPCIRGWMDAETVTCPGTGDDTALTFDVWENGNQNVFSPNLTGSPAVLASVDALVEGVFLINVQVEFDVTLSNPTGVGLAVEEGATFEPSPVVVHLAQPRAGSNSGGKYSMNLVKGYPPVWVHAGFSNCASGPCLPTWTFQAAQNSGTDHDAVNGMFEIYLIGGLSVDTSELGP